MKENMQPRWPVRGSPPRKSFQPIQVIRTLARVPLKNWCLILLHKPQHTKEL